MQGPVLVSGRREVRPRRSQIPSQARDDTPGNDRDRALLRVFVSSFDPFTVTGAKVFRPYVTPHTAMDPGVRRGDAPMCAPAPLSFLPSRLRVFA